MTLHSSSKWMKALQNFTGVESRGLKLVKLEPEHVFAFKMSKENVREFEVVYQQDPIQSLLEASRHPGSFAVVKDGKVLAITGIVDAKGEGLIWSLFSFEMRNNFIRFARASMDLMEAYHQEYTTLVCDIWVENKMIAQWLAFLGFEPEFGFTHNGADMVRFVRCCGDFEYELPFAQRPVLH